MDMASFSSSQSAIVTPIMSFLSGPFAGQAQRVLREVEGYTPDNTKLAYQPKEQEFFEMCDKVFGNDENPRTITEPKFFIFLYYQLFRPHKERKKKRGPDGELLEQRERFDVEKFNAITNAYRSDLMGEGNTRGPVPTLSEVEANRRKDAGKNKLLGISSYKQYYSAVMNAWQRQVDNHANNLSKEQLVSSRVKQLKLLVSKRKAAVKKANYEEKISNGVSPFLMIEKIADLELTMFNRNNTSQVNGIAGLRNRFTLLVTLQAILRGESVFKCELSDLCDFLYQGK